VVAVSPAPGLEGVGMAWGLGLLAVSVVMLIAGAELHQ
jgi:hypothetical protein